MKYIKVRTCAGCPFYEQNIPRYCSRTQQRVPNRVKVDDFIWKSCPLDDYEDVAEDYDPGYDQGYEDGLNGVWENGGGYSGGV